MNIKQIGIGLVLADFVALTAYAIWQYGYAAFFDLATMNAITVQVSIDLVIALAIVSVWMVGDARARGASANRPGADAAGQPCLKAKGAAAPAHWCGRSGAWSSAARSLWRRLAPSRESRRWRSSVSSSPRRRRSSSRSSRACSASTVRR